MTPETFLLNAILLTSGRAKERDGWPLQPNTDVSTTRLHCGLDNTSQVPSTASTGSEFRIWIWDTGWKIDCTGRVALSEYLPVFDNAAALPAHGVGRPGRMLQLVPAQHHSQEPGIRTKHFGYQMLVTFLNTFRVEPNNWLSAAILVNPQIKIYLKRGRRLPGPVLIGAISAGILRVMN
jgi:hypothetical protein